VDEKKEARRIYRHRLEEGSFFGVVAQPHSHFIYYAATMRRGREEKKLKEERIKRCA
jgi:hypothetical protein